METARESFQLVVHHPEQVEEALERLTDIGKGLFIVGTTENKDKNTVIALDGEKSAHDAVHRRMLGLDHKDEDTISSKVTGIKHYTLSPNTMPQFI